MKVEKKGHTAIIKDTNGNAADFLKKVTAEYSSFKNKNIILDISRNKNMELTHLLTFLSLSNKHRKTKKSFIIVIEDFDFNEVPEEMMVVPTLQEAKDIIEMEEIERDLGF